VLAVRKVHPNDIATEIGQPDFTELIERFIHDQEHPESDSDTNVVDPGPFYGNITVYASAVATFHAPSDISGVGGMRRERIHAVKSWRKGPARYDTVFVNMNSAKGMRGLDVARVRLLFSFAREGVQYPCALVHWFSRVDESPSENTGMWIVEPVAEHPDDGGDSRAVVLHLDTIVRAAHLLPVFGHRFVPRTLPFTSTLDAFPTFYVNKFADHHSFETAF
jgi:hypothetical protein